MPRPIHHPTLPSRHRRQTGQHTRPLQRKAAKHAHVFHVVASCSAPVRNSPGSPRYNRTAGRLLPSELPSLSQPPHMSLRLPRTSRGALATTNRPLRTTPAAPRQRMNIALARYTTAHPPTFHPRSPAPILDDEGKLRILFIGPGQASTGVTPSQTPGARLAEASAFAPDLSPSLNHRPPSTIMGEMPYEGNEYGRMNDASHLVLHGGN